jgi:cytochrome c-type biogenesis protein CcmH/NrfG
MRRNEPEQAIKELEKIDQARPRERSYLQELAAAYQKTGDLSKAASVRERYAAHQKMASRINVLKTKLSNEPDDFANTIAILRLLLGTDNPEDAEKYLKTAQKLRPQSAQVKTLSAQIEKLYRGHLQSSRTALTNGDADKAGWHLGQASILRPSDEATRQAIQYYTEQTGGKLPQTIIDLGRVRQE